jgi:hypothetical protein
MRLLEAIKRESGIQEMTADSIAKIIDEVNRDPLIGLGTMSKKQHLVDRLLAHWRICSAQIKGTPVRDPAALVLDKPVPSATAEKAAQLTKAAGL